MSWNANFKDLGVLNALGGCLAETIIARVADRLYCATVRFRKQSAGGGTS